MCRNFVSKFLFRWRQQRHEIEEALLKDFRCCPCDDVRLTRELGWIRRCPFTAVPETWT